jgi:hypothetical protein
MKTMKKEMSVFTALFICAVLTFTAAGVRATAVSTSQARMDWTSLTINGDITWGDKSSQSYAYAEDATGWDDGSQYESGWVNTSAYASVYHAYSDASTSDYSLYEEVYAIANDAVTTWASAEEVYAYRWGNFTADSNGLVTFSADYELWQQLLTDYVGEYAYGYAEAGLWLYSYDTAVRDYDYSSLNNEVWDGDSITVGDDGTLTVAVWFNAGNSGQLQAWASNDADVQIPEPATIALLGLGALSLIRRKRSV